MARSVATAEQVMEGQRVAESYLPLVGAVPPQVSTGNSVACVDLCGLLADAIDATGSRKEAAADMKLSAPVLTKQLGRVDDAAPRLDRMSGLKRETLIAFADRIKTACDAADPAVEQRRTVEEAARAIGKLVALAMRA
jgi:hypothetical protein